MPIEIKMPALSPTMEEGTLARWAVKEGDELRAGDLIAEIETDKATMEFEAVDEGRVVQLVVPEGSDGVKVGTVIALLAGEGEDASAPAQPAAAAPAAPTAAAPEPAALQPEIRGYGANPAEDAAIAQGTALRAGSATPTPAPQPSGERVKASPLARRIAEQRGVNLAAVTGSGPGGRVIKADVEGAQPGAAPVAQPAPAPAAQPTAQPAAAVEAAASAAPAPKPAAVPDIPHETTKLSNMRKTIARRLTESKQQVPHIYLTVDVRLDALLKMRGELNVALGSRGVKLSVNDMLVKALGVSLIQVPKCNVMFTATELISFTRADISVAVSTPTGLITPIVKDAANRALSAIATEIKDLAARARDGKLKPEEFQGGTASLSNMGMFGIKQFEAVINPPQGMIMAIGAGEKRPYVIDDALGVATVMSATGSFDHRAIDGADGAQLMQAFKELVENPLGMLA